MVAMTPSEWRRVGEAIVVWSGWGQASHPLRDERLVMRHFGHSAAIQLLPVVRSLVDDFYSSDARYSAMDLAEMGRLSFDEFAKKYPELPRDAVSALAWIVLMRLLHWHVPQAEASDVLPLMPYRRPRYAVVHQCCLGPPPGRRLPCCPLGQRPRCG